MTSKRLSPITEVDRQKIVQKIFALEEKAIALLDNRGNFVEVNPSTCQLLALSRQKLLKRGLANFLPPQFQFELFLSRLKRDRQLTGHWHLIISQEKQIDVEYALTYNIFPHRHLLSLKIRQDNVEEELKRERQRLELFAEVSLKIRQSLQLKEILRTTVNEVQRILHADRVLIYQVLADGTGKAISEAVLPNYPAILGQEFPVEVFPEEYQELYATGRVRAIADVHNPQAGLADCLVEFIDQFEIKAKLIVPIVQNLNSNSDRLWGLLIAHQCDGPRQWIDFELELMQQLADQISIAIAQARLLENLEELVAARTTELKQQINDRLEAEEALRRSEEQLRSIANALPVLIAYVDSQQKYRFNNQAYQDWLDKSPQEISGSHLREVWGESSYEKMRPHIESALQGNIAIYENEISIQEKSSRSVSVTYIPHLEETTVKGFFSLTSDISERKAIERMKDEFISVVSHELRTPLTSLHSALKILATGRLGTLSTDGKQMLAIADENTERLVRLVNSVLDLQRIESGEVTMEKQLCSTSELTIRAIEAMQPMAQQHEVTLIAEPMDIQISVDPDYILQALTNLLSNAIKFSLPGGKVWLTVEYKKLTKSIQVNKTKSREVLFQIRDRGQGVPTDKLESIFERFKQVDSSDARKKGGTGLGLTICRKIIEQHDGRIWAESVLGEGSTFFFTLPI
jgi:PAS domain S-box-containing protein